MKHLVTASEMQFLDNNTINNFGIPQQNLIEEAARVFVEEFFRLVGDKVQSGIVFCGNGNNGADGMVIARILNEREIKTKICKVSDILGQDTDVFDKEYDFVIDAIFGVGLSRDLSNEYISIVENINSLSGIKVAVDMPSGISSDNGQIMGAAVKCDYTITFSFEKCGAHLWPGTDHVGKLVLAPTSITEAAWLDRSPSIIKLEDSDLYNLPIRPAHSNKGTFGKLLIIAGNVNMAGAAILSAKAAYRCGVGLVKVYTREENRTILQTAVPEAVLSTYGDTIDTTRLLEDINWSDAIVIGPGIGTSKEATELVAMVHKYAKSPVLWDADALNIWAEDTYRLKESHMEYIFTPHLGEFSRLTGLSISDIQKNIINSAISFAIDYNSICVLKDFHSVIGNHKGKSYLNLSGNNGMATAGSGDVLSGIIGALLAQGMSSADAASFGVLIHGLAGDDAREKMGTHAIMASDIIEGLKNLWKKVDNNAKQ